MSESEMKRIYISCVPGLEPVLTKECEHIGIKLTNPNSKSVSDIQLHGTDEEKGGIEFLGSDKELYLSNLQLRTASRVIVRLGEFYAAAFSELRKKASRLPWELYLKPGQNVEIKVTCHKSRLYHSDAVAERVRGAIDDHFHRSSETSPKTEVKLTILVRLVNDLCTISIDSSGELLHRRGYRQAVAKAPLRENLAAGMLLASGWQPGSPLIDPFCGSGTIPIEAALMARGIAPGINRRFAFMDWVGYQPELYRQLLSEAQNAIHPSNAMIYASDRDRGAVEMATANAARTGVNQDIRFACHAFSDLPDFPDQGWIVTNPPYGKRIHSSKDLRDLYSSLGRLFQNRFQGWKLALISSEPALIHALDLEKPKTTIHLINGGIPVTFSVFSN